MAEKMVEHFKPSNGTYMATEMNFKLLPAKKRKEEVNLGTKKFRVWSRYTCTFTTKPNKGQLSHKKRKMRKFLLNGNAENKGLLQLTNGKRFALKLRWKKDEKNSLVYHLVAFTRAKNDPPDRSTTPPQPPPKGPGPL